MARAVNKQKRLACVQCKTRKVRCDYYDRASTGKSDLSCTNCIKWKTKCMIAADKRKSRICKKDVFELRSKIEELENYIKVIENGRVSNNITLSSILNYDYDYDYNYNYGYDYDKDSNFDISGQNCRSFPNNEDKNDENYTSIFRKSNRNIDIKRSYSIINLMNKEPVIIKCIKLYFQWFYPDLNIFLPRETFLIDFFHPNNFNNFQDDYYCSKELIFAICSFGILLNQDYELGERKALSLEFYKKSENWIFSNYSINNITKVQTFILLGIYNLYQGNREKSMILIETGIKIGIKINFNFGNTNSETESNTESKTGSKRENEIIKIFKSRIYWGCFLIENFNSLINGKLNEFNLNINYNNFKLFNKFDKVPDLDWIKEFNFSNCNEIIDIVNPMKAIIKMIFIVNRYRESLANSGDGNGAEGEGEGEGEGMIIKFNQEIDNWRDGLEENLQWDEKQIESKSVRSPEMVHIYYYYIIKICMNLKYMKTVTNINNGYSIRGEIEKAVDVMYTSIKGFVKKFGTKRMAFIQIVGMIYIVIAVEEEFGNGIDVTGSGIVTVLQGVAQLADSVCTMWPVLAAFVARAHAVVSNAVPAPAVPQAAAVPAPAASFCPWSPRAVGVPVAHPESDVMADAVLQQLFVELGLLPA